MNLSDVIIHILEQQGELLADGMMGLPVFSLMTALNMSLLYSGRGKGGTLSMQQRGAIKALPRLDRRFGFRLERGSTYLVFRRYPGGTSLTLGRADE